MSIALCLGLACVPWKATKTDAVALDKEVQGLLTVIDGMSAQVAGAAADKQYEAYIGLPLDLRREVYVRLTPEAKATIWKGHFRHCLAALPLTPEQQACIRKADELMSLALYQPFTGVSHFVDTVEGYRSYFEPTLFAFVFYGDEPATGGQQRGLFSRHTDPRLQSAAGCNCRTYVSKASNCGETGSDCGNSHLCSSYNSCGPGGTQTCDGLCL